MFDCLHFRSLILRLDPSDVPKRVYDSSHFRSYFIFVISIPHFMYLLCVRTNTYIVYSSSMSLPLQPRGLPGKNQSWYKIEGNMQEYAHVCHWWIWKLTADIFWQLDETTSLNYNHLTSIHTVFTHTKGKGPYRSLHLSIVLSTLFHTW